VFDQVYGYIAFLLKAGSPLPDDVGLKLLIWVASCDILKHFCACSINSSGVIRVGIFTSKDITFKSRAQLFRVRSSVWLCPEMPPFF